jgi:hypothetical protein
MVKPIGVPLCSDQGARRRARKDASAQCNDVVKMCGVKNVCYLLSLKGAEPLNVAIYIYKSRQACPG